MEMAGTNGTLIISARAKPAHDTFTHRTPQTPHTKHAKEKSTLLR